MRATCWARWATCALAISICVPAFADHARRSISSCASFDQSDQGDAKVAFTIRNACTIPLDCAVSWRVVCAPASRTRRGSHPSSLRLAIAEGTSQSAAASAEVCGDDAWTIDSVQWSCQPDKT